LKDSHIIFRFSGEEEEEDEEEVARTEEEKIERVTRRE